MSCSLCNGACQKADITPLLVPDLAWLWEQIADAADRRGEEEMTAGRLKVSLPPEARRRYAARGLLGTKPVTGKTTVVRLAALTTVLAERHPSLTPGVIAAHATGRRLAVGAREREAREAATAAIRARLGHGIGRLPQNLGIEADDTLSRLSRSGRLARIRAATDPEVLIDAALAVLARLPAPGDRIDRRTLVDGDPHALDRGPLPSLALAIAGVSALAPREAWDRLGVDIDNLVGGLIVTGLHPEGWVLPPAVTATLPPRELQGIRWTSPETPGQWAFVTENPSVLSAAADAFRTDTVTEQAQPHVVCTAGTPSHLECAAIGALTEAGWRVAVRADFDVSGLAHVRAILDAAPVAVPWRMTAADYLQTHGEKNPASTNVDGSASPWDPDLARLMAARGTPGYEEDLLGLLIDDVGRGHPGSPQEDARLTMPPQS